MYNLLEACQWAVLLSAKAENISDRLQCCRGIGQQSFVVERWELSRLESTDVELECRLYSSRFTNKRFLSAYHTMWALSQHFSLNVS